MGVNSYGVTYIYLHVSDYRFVFVVAIVVCVDVGGVRCGVCCCYCVGMYDGCVCVVVVVGGCECDGDGGVVVVTGYGVGGADDVDGGVADGGGGLDVFGVSVDVVVDIVVDGGSVVVFCW